MLKIQFTNAQAEDSGYGLSVNGKSLDEVISTALGTRVGNTYGYGSGLPQFNSKCCDITIIIEPKRVKETIETECEVWESIHELEECKREQFIQKTKPTES